MKERETSSKIFFNNKIIPILENNCNNGNGKYCKVLAKLYPEEKEKYLSQGCEKKDEQDCMDLVLYYKDKKEYDKALEYAKKTCELKSNKNCSLIYYINGFVYYYQKRDLNKAINSFLKSAKDYPMAYCDIGDLQEKNRKKVEFYQKCCDAGIQKGCDNLSSINTKTDIK